MANRIDLNRYSIRSDQEGQADSLNLQALGEHLNTVESANRYQCIFSILSSGSLNQFHNKEDAILDLKGRALPLARMFPQEIIQSIEIFDLNDNNLKQIYDIAKTTLDNRQAELGQQRPSFLTILKDRTLTTFDPTKMTQGAACAIFVAAQFFKEARETESLADDFYMPAFGFSLGCLSVTVVNAVAAAIQNHNINRIAAR